MFRVHNIKQPQTAHSDLHRSVYYEPRWNELMLEKATLKTITTYFTVALRNSKGSTASTQMEKMLEDNIL